MDVRSKSRCLIGIDNVQSTVSKNIGPCGETSLFWDRAYIVSSGCRTIGEEPLTDWCLALSPSKLCHLLRIRTHIYLPRTDGSLKDDSATNRSFWWYLTLEHCLGMSTPGNSVSTEPNLGMVCQRESVALQSSVGSGTFLMTHEPNRDCHSTSFNILSLSPSFPKWPWGAMSADPNYSGKSVYTTSTSYREPWNMPLKQY